MIGTENGTARNHTALHGGSRHVRVVAATQPRASMAAYVVERAQDALTIADDEDALAEDIENQVVPGLRQLLLAGGAEPFSAEDPFLLQLKSLLGVVPAGWQS